MGKYVHLRGCRCKGKVPLDRDHPWFVKSPDHMNCFWTYLRHNTRPHTLSEIAELLEVSISAITSVEGKALKKMRNRVRYLSLEDKE